jgi:hypothetical protein
MYRYGTSNYSGCIRHTETGSAVEHRPRISRGSPLHRERDLTLKSTGRRDDIHHEKEESESHAQPRGEIVAIPFGNALSTNLGAQRFAVFRDAFCGWEGTG